MIERRSSSPITPRAIPTLAWSCRNAATYAVLLPRKCIPITDVSALRIAWVEACAVALATAREWAAVKARWGSRVTREIEDATAQRTGWPRTVQREPGGKIS